MESAHHFLSSKHRKAEKTRMVGVITSLKFKTMCVCMCTYACVHAPMHMKKKTIKPLVVLRSYSSDASRLLRQDFHSNYCHRNQQSSCHPATLHLCQEEVLSAPLAVCGNAFIFCWLRSLGETGQLVPHGVTLDQRRMGECE